MYDEKRTKRYRSLLYHIQPFFFFFGLYLMLEQTVTELRTQLDAERKKNKDLSMNVVKLNGIIKTGQDALSQEQGLVKKLQESLDSKSMVTSSLFKLSFKCPEHQKLAYIFFNLLPKK